MNLLEINIDGFGQLHQIKLQVDAPLVVIYGYNEAGKSTLFQFIHTMLFGFARKNQLERFLEPVHGGRHGGSIIFATDDGETVQLSRYRDQHQGKAQLAKLQREHSTGSYIPLTQSVIMDQDQLERKYFSGVNGRLFQQISAISLNELQATSVMSESELSQYLYHASWESGRYIAELEKQLTNEQEKLFKPRGQNQLITQELKQLDQLKQQYKQVERELEQFVSLQTELEQCERRLHIIQNELQVQQHIVQVHNKAGNQRDWWLEQQLIESQLQQLQHVKELPLSLNSQVDQILRSEHLLQEEWQQALVAKNQLERKISMIEVDESIIERESQIERYVQLATVMEEQQEQLVLRQEELQQQEQLLTELRYQLPSYWSEEQLRRLAITSEQRIEYEQQLTEYRHLIQHEQTLGQQEAQQQDEAILLQQQVDTVTQKEYLHEVELKQFRLANGLLPQSEAELHEATLLLQEAYRQYDYERMNGQATLRQESQGFKEASTGRRSREREKGESYFTILVMGTIATVLVIISILASSKLIVVDQISWLFPILLIATVITAVSTAILWSKKQSQGKNHHYSRVMSGDGWQGLYRALSQIVELGQPVEEQHYYEYRRQLQEQIDRLLLMYQQQERIYQNKLQLQEQQEKNRLASFAIAEKKRKIAFRKEELQQQWNTFATEHQLPEHCHIEHFSDVLMHYRNMQHQYESRDKLQQLIAQYEQRIDEYTDEVYGLTRLPWKQSVPEGSQQMQLSFMRKQIQIQKQQQEERELLKEELQRYQLQHEAVQQQIAELHDKLDQLQRLCKVKATDELLFVVEQRNSYEQSKAQYERILLQRRSGVTADDLSAIDELFATYDEDGLREKIFLEHNSYEELLSQQQQWLEDRGRLMQQQDRLMNSDEHQQLLLQKEAVSTQLDGLLAKYMKLSLSKMLLKKTKEKYEQERQPEVLLKASQYFEKLSNGAYTAIIGNAELETLLLRATNGALMESELLSRGTSELLYFCIRLACHDAAVQHAHLPLVLDDPCVNFDEQRLDAAAKLLSELTEQRQLIYFTCHSHTVEHLIASSTKAITHTLQKQSTSVMI